MRDKFPVLETAELARLCQWNSKLAIYIVRRRINHWTKNEFPSPIGGEDSLMQKMEQIVLCRDLLLVYAALAQNILNSGDNGGLLAAGPTFTVSW